MKIEGYAILKELSRGPITTVYAGKQLALERQVLIKVLNSQWQQESDLLERFRREAIICARLKHPNIVNIFDVSTDPKNLYLIIEFLEGENLSKFIQQHHPLPFDVILHISKEILKGLAYAHSRGIIHRDIKPGNIMIDREGAVKITDFGLARAEDLPAITVQGGTVGTPAYMSPEQAKGQELDQQTDIFSLGATMYELVSGASPFAGKNFAESIQKILDLSPQPLMQIRPEILNWFSDLVSEMLNKSPKDRPESAKKILGNSGFKKSILTPEGLAGFIANPSVFSIGKAEAETQPETQKPASQKRFFLAGIGILAILAALLLFQSFQFEPPLKNNTSGELSNNRGEQITTVSNDTLPATTSSPALAEPSSRNKQPLTGEDLKNSTSTKLLSDIPIDSLDSIKLPDSQKIAAFEKPGILENGSLFVTCNPWAKIFIDSIEVETTPLLAPISLPAGEYYLELRNPNFQSYHQKIVVEAGKPDSIVVDLVPLTGYLELRVIPWAKVFIDGNYYETTPLKKPIQLSTGSYEITLINQNFPTWVDSIFIVAGKTVLREVSLKK